MKKTNFTAKAGPCKIWKKTKPIFNFFLALLVFTLFFTATSIAENLTVRPENLATKEANEGVRIIISTSGLAKFESYWLDTPPRLVVEFQTRNIISRIDNEILLNQGVIKKITSEYFGSGEKKSLKSLTFELAQKVPYKIWQEADTVILDIQAPLEMSMLPKEEKEVFAKNETRDVTIRRLEAMGTALAKVSASRSSSAPPKAIAEFPKSRGRRNTMVIALWFIGLALVSGLGGLLFWRRYRLILDKNKSIQEIRKLREQLKEQNILLEHEQIVRKTIEDTSLKKENEFEQLELELQKEKQLLEEEEKVRKRVEEELSQKVKECDETKISLGSLKEMLVEKGLAKKLTTPMEEGEVWIPGKSAERREFARLDLSRDYNQTIIVRIETEDKSKSIKSFANNIGLGGLCFETRSEFKEKEILNLRLFFFGDKVPMMKIQAWVIWKKSEPPVNRYGVAFTHLEEKDKIELNRYIESKIVI